MARKFFCECDVSGVGGERLGTASDWERRAAWAAERGNETTPTKFRRRRSKSNDYGSKFRGAKLRPMAMAKKSAKWFSREHAKKMVEGAAKKMVEDVGEGGFAN